MDSIHHTYTSYVQLIVRKLLQVIVDNSGIVVPLEDPDKRARSALTAMQCLIMVIKCITLKKFADNSSDSVKQFFTHWNSLHPDDMVCSILVYSLKASAFSRGANFRPRIFNTITAVVDGAEKYMKQTKYSKALSLIDRQLAAMNILDTNEANPVETHMPFEESVDLTARLHPDRDDILDKVDDINPLEAGNFANISATPEDIINVVKSLDTTASEGLDSWSFFHLKKIILYIDSDDGNDDGNPANIHNELIGLLVQLCNLFIQGTVGNSSLWSLSRLIYMPKDDGGYRPIAVGSSLYRLLAKVVISLVAKTCGEALAPIQIGVGIKDGGAILATSLNALTCENDDVCILSFDVENAFNTERRRRTAMGIAKYCPSLLGLYKRLYGIPSSSLRNSLGQLLGKSCSGVRQGDPLAMLFFCCSIQDTLLEINGMIKAEIAAALASTDGGNDDNFLQVHLQGSYADDLNICLHVTIAERVFMNTMDIFEMNGFRLNRQKSTIFLPSSNRAAEEGDAARANILFPVTREHVVGKTKILGVVFGGDDDVRAGFNKQFSEISRLLALLKHIPSSISFYLIKYCINAMPSYLHRIFKPLVTSTYSVSLDALIHSAIEHIIQAPLPSESCFLLRAPCKLGGIGIQPWSSFIPHIQYDLVQQRTGDFLRQHAAFYQNAVINRIIATRSHIPDANLGFSAATRDYINNPSSKRTLIMHTRHHSEFMVELRARNRLDIIDHMEHQNFHTSGLLFGITYIRNSFTKDFAYFGECLGYRLKVPLIDAPLFHPAIPPPRQHYACRWCDAHGRSYNINHTLFEHCVRCQCMGSDISYRHDAAAAAIQTYVREILHDSVEIIKGTNGNTNGDRGQICDFIIRGRGRPDIKFDVTFTGGVDAHQHNNILTAPLASIVTAENNKRVHYQRNNGSHGDVIPLALSFSGYYLGPSFVAFCNTIESYTHGNAALTFDYSAHVGVKFVRDFHPARRRLISEINRLCYLFIAKARIRARQQVYLHNTPAFVYPPVITNSHGRPPVAQMD